MLWAQCRAPGSLPPGACIWPGNPGGSQISNSTLTTVDGCCALCQSTPGCLSWIAEGERQLCILRNIATTDNATKTGCQSGIVPPPPSPAPGPAPRAAKNVLYLLADDLRPEMRLAYGQRAAITPNLDKLASSALTFGKAYCQQAVCGASRNSFMTGRRPHRTNVLGTRTGSDFRKVGIDSLGVPGARWVTLPQHFKRQNYTVLGGGKTFHPGNPKDFDYPSSWTDWGGAANGGHPPRSNPPAGFADNYFAYSYWLTNKSTGVGYGGPCPGFAKPQDDPAGLAGPIAVWCALDEPDAHFYDHGLANDTIARMRFAVAQKQPDGVTQRPFFIQSGFARPHTPWRVPQRFWDLYNTSSIALATHKLPPQDMPGAAWMAHSFFNATTGATFPLSVTAPLDGEVARTARHAYYASVSWLDHQVGRVLDELEALGVADDTLVVLHGDHGWQLGEHNSWHKYTNFELGARVPLLVRAPWLPASAGRMAQGLVELVDAYPTVAELAGTPAPTDALDGVSLAPFFADPSRLTFPTGAAQGTRNKSLAFSQYPHTAGALVPALACPFFDASSGACSDAPLGGAAAAAAAAKPANPANPAKPAKPAKVSWMGFSVRDQAWRYTAWLPYNGTRADWDAPRGAAGLVEELYNHSGLDGTDFDAMDTRNLAYVKELADTVHDFFGKAREFFDVLAPPTGGLATTKQATHSAKLPY